MRTGRVYKLSSKDENCKKVYIGSTKSPYVCIRMAHHRERHRKGWQDYQGIFDAGEPKLEILETMEFEDEEGWRLRQAEQKWADMTDNRSEEHTSELQSPCNLVCRLLLEKKNKT